MGFGFRRSFKIAPGIRMSASKSGIGLSFGGKGLRYSVHSSGRRRMTTSIPGTGISYTSSNSTRRNYRSNPYQRHQQILQREQQAREEKDRNRLIVEKFDNRIEMIKSIHKECDDEIDWLDIKNVPAPFQRDQKGPLEIAATSKYLNYRPGFFVKLFKTETKQKNKLLLDIQNASKEDTRAYQEWLELNIIANRVLKGDVDAFFEVIDQMSPLDDLLEFGSGFEFFCENPNFMNIEFDVHSNSVVPQKALTLTKTGKISEKEMTKTQYYDIQQDYICSCILRIARDMFAILPLKHLVIDAMDEQLNTATGYSERVCILSVHLKRDQMNRLNFEYIDCSDAISGFEHRMKFKKTGGFAPVQPITSHDIQI
ncbi:DUF4236 domain-containing protein [Paenibacillus sp. PL2-23]|uniref:DUF4236 domain-containing protein n=1 Tax=Paenibacillus sp. PL2-23 TaxID=2100729 RepID=UPI0030F94A33